MNFAIKARAEQVYLFCRAVAKSRHYEVLPQKYGALRARLIVWRQQGQQGQQRQQREFLILCFVVVSFVSFVSFIHFVLPFRLLPQAPRPNFSEEGCRYNARQKSRRWAVLSVLLIVGTFLLAAVDVCLIIENLIFDFRGADLFYRINKISWDST